MLTILHVTLYEFHLSGSDHQMEYQQIYQNPGTTLI